MLVFTAGAPRARRPTRCAPNDSGARHALTPHTNTHALARHAHPFVRPHLARAPCSRGHVSIPPRAYSSAVSAAAACAFDVCVPWHTIPGQARPRVNESGSPPGIWMAQSHGLHFALASSWAARERARAAQPPLAHNEMPRAIANRIWDILCPFPTMINPSQVKGRSHRAARSHARPAR